MCEWCAGYGHGYAAGNAKAHDEFRVGYWRDHGPGCGCEPCQTVRAAFVAAAAPDAAAGLL